MKKFFKLFFGFFVLLESTALCVSDIETEDFVAGTLMTIIISAVIAMSATGLQSRKKY